MSVTLKPNSGFHELRPCFPHRLLIPKFRYHIYQIEFTNICHVECQNVCQIECQNICQIECQKICRGECQTKFMSFIYIYISYDYARRHVTFPYKEFCRHTLCRRWDASMTWFQSLKFCQNQITRIFFQTMTQMKPLVCNAVQCTHSTLKH